MEGNEINPQSLASLILESQGSPEQGIILLTNTIQILRKLQKRPKADSEGSEHYSESNPSRDVIVQQLPLHHDKYDEMTNISLVLLIPQTVVGTVIGKKGSTILEVQCTSEAQITMEKEDEMPMCVPERKVFIEGNLASVCAAEQLILHTISENAAQGSVVAETLNFLVPNVAVRYLIGKSGSSISEIERTTGTKIQFEKEDKIYYPPGRKTTISGGTNGHISRTSALYYILRRLAMNEKYADSKQFSVQIVTYAKLQLQQQIMANHYMGAFSQSAAVYDQSSASSLAAYGQQGQTQTQEIYVDNAVVGKLIGKGGAFINDLQQKSGAHIQFDQEPTSDMKERRVLITGTPYSVHLAHTLIESSLANWMAKLSPTA
eukprot:TRINITY_DN8632_c0_g1::TRINITY_DN8632_c0_g1_i1::g.328::m.328 TRINITY_DN8632_c0_g1::TRINITY_DN8632_c0_g1_i1::g.328  ORF type:complete len:384 (-),score=77.12,sp/P57724/PCBP4_MOUSE/29.58/3e-21,KH_1/PF00013.24/2.2e-10,KH_1/PF00013.24/2.6e-11,KH_1/PF00013.24/9.4e-16,KH_3/PF13014.1/0.0026,KH_3/PF13014.1/8.3e-09,KH_3/PF13014.1/7.2e-13,KH_2/PF07650.12/0.53,KH_2/PF07650.12/1.5,KH_2/PF07650.12/0.32,KH_4/PF13083.1/3.7,KH_4/PF13083.1/2.2e+03,KH_4/PF13083.1/0.11,KH_5/PF13184.1/1e+02,KH_5/PF13184.1/15,KH_5/PF